MTIKAHVRELKEKHKALKRKLSKTIAHLAASDEEITELKRRKLRIKDEINSFQF